MREPGPNAGRPHPAKVIVVNDERLIADMFAAILNHSGYRALPVYSPRDAIEHAKVIRFDAALLGGVMPGMNGVELGLVLRRLQPRCKFALCALDAWPELEAFADARGFRFKYVRLPVQPVEFLRSVQILLTGVRT